MPLWQVVGYITGTIELVTNLPSELAAFPGQVRCCPSQMLAALHALPYCMPSLLPCPQSPQLHTPATVWPVHCLAHTDVIVYSHMITLLVRRLTAGGVCACSGGAQLAEAADPANQPDPTQLTNGTYLQEQFETLVEGLEHPVAVGGGGSVFSYNPCYINLAPGGVQARALPASHKLPLPSKLLLKGFSHFHGEDVFGVLVAGPA